MKSNTWNMRRSSSGLGASRFIYSTLRREIPGTIYTSTCQSRGEVPWTSDERCCSPFSCNFTETPVATTSSLNNRMVTVVVNCRDPRVDLLCAITCFRSDDHCYTHSFTEDLCISHRSALMIFPPTDNRSNKYTLFISPFSRLFVSIGLFSPRSDMQIKGDRDGKGDREFLFSLQCFPNVKRWVHLPNLGFLKRGIWNWYVRSTPKTSLWKKSWLVKNANLIRFLFVRLFRYDSRLHSNWIVY